MRAFLLAAGKGSRISKNIPEIPKCTLDVDGKPLIKRTVEMLLENQIDITIVVGYKHEYIEELLRPYEVDIVYNPFFDVTNSIGSLWLAKDRIKPGEEMLVANADVFWSQDILDFILQQQQEVFLLSDELRVEDGDYFFNTSNGVITAYGKELERHERTCEYVGIAYIGQGFAEKFKRRLEDMVSRQQHQWWWENVLYSFTGEQEIYAIDVAGKFWAEIDFIEDYHRILNYVDKTENRG